MYIRLSQSQIDAIIAALWHAQQTASPEAYAELAALRKHIAEENAE
jgi:hypothetical protein